MHTYYEQDWSLADDTSSSMVLAKRYIEDLRDFTQIITKACNDFEQTIKAHDPERIVRVCPICSGRMVDVSTLLRAIGKLQRSTFRIYEAQGQLNPSLYWYEYNYDEEDKGSIWECKKCQGVTVQPRDSRTQWLRGEGSPSSFAGQLFRYSKQVDEVTYDHNSYYALYMVRCGKEWFRFFGTKDEVLERIGVPL